MSAERPATTRDRLRVARRGNRLELVVNGISYSSFHPERPWTGYVWDALAGTVCLTRREDPSVLLLGGGAGTVLALLRRLRPRARLVAVEIEPRVIEVARRQFGLDAFDAEVVEADGVEYLARTRRSFDLIIDDMYAPGVDGLVRPVPNEAEHLARIAKRLAPRGVAATNSTTDEDPPGLLRTLRRAYRLTFPHRLSLAPRRGFNVVLAGSVDPLAFTPQDGTFPAVSREDAEELSRLRVRRG